MAEITDTYWDKIPVWDEKKEVESFDVIADDLSGRIPVTKLEHWRDFSTLLDSKFFNSAKTEYVYRGHRRFEWEMTPTLGRLSKDGIVTEQSANEQLSLFRKAIRGRIHDHSLLDDDNEREDDELWSIGQHHGLMTPLLDWTHSPYVALFFAFGKPDKDPKNKYRAVYILNKSFINDVESYFDLENGNREEIDSLCNAIRLFEPRKDDHGRLVSQAGLFTFSPFDSTIENKLIEILTHSDFLDDELKSATDEEQASIIAKYICKVYIKNEDQPDCLRFLRRMNVHHASLFPDLIGAADYCNIRISEQIENEKQQIKEKKSPEVSEVETTEILQDDVIEENPHNATTVQELLTIALDGDEYPDDRLLELTSTLTKELTKSKRIDWEERETIQAEMKRKTRLLLRKFGFPTGSGKYVTENLLSVVKRFEGEETQDDE